MRRLLLLSLSLLMFAAIVPSTADAGEGKDNESLQSQKDVLAALIILAQQRKQGTPAAPPPPPPERDRPDPPAPAPEAGPQGPS